MTNWINRARYPLRFLEMPEDMSAVEELQRQVWPGDDTEVVPAHMLMAAAHNGGLVIGAFDKGAHPASGEEDAWIDTGSSMRADIPPEATLVGFVFGFPGLYFTPDGPRPKHCSHMMGVLSEYRDKGIGFALKRAQWQVVRHQGLDRITWTYDPLLSRNAHVNIARLGAVCNTYVREAYGQLRDGLNLGLPSDRFQVDWWINSQRVFRRLSKRPRRRLDLAHFLAAGVVILNPTQIGEDGLPRLVLDNAVEGIEDLVKQNQEQPMMLVEIPADFLALKAADLTLAQQWRMYTRALFEDLFERGYLVTDFIHLPGPSPRSFYVVSHGESTL